jgi:iron(III) transport system substrate-binding protein
MRIIVKPFIAPVCLVLLLYTQIGCGERTAPANEVVVFTALDRVYSEPILKRFEQQTGIRVLAKYDAEAAKTTGLINQIIARRDDPQCDVLWNNEVVQTQHLAGLGVLEPYESTAASRFGPAFQDPRHRWTGFAARARVFIYNTELVGADEIPTSLADMADPKWQDRSAIAMPFFGTTFTHMSVLRQVWGDDRLIKWLTDIKANGVAIAPGNGSVRDLVASGERALGLTDTDDAHGAMLDGKPVAVVVPDAGQGAVLIPNTVAIIAGCPHPEQARLLIDYLLSAEVERALAEARSAQIPLGKDLADLSTVWDRLIDQDTMPFDVEAATGDRRATVDLLRQVGFDR